MLSNCQNKKCCEWSKETGTNCLRWPMREEWGSVVKCNESIIVTTYNPCPECDGELTEQGYCSSCRGAGQ